MWQVTLAKAAKQFLRDYWPHCLLVVLVVVGIWAGLAKAYDMGQADVQAQWDAETQAEKEAIEKKRAEEQSLADRIAAETAQTIQDLQDQAADYQKRLNDEKSRNRIYTDCVVPDAGIMLYNEAISASTR